VFTIIHCTSSVGSERPWLRMEDSRSMWVAVYWPHFHPHASQGPGVQASLLRMAMSGSGVYSSCSLRLQSVFPDSNTRKFSSASHTFRY
jgi:hypothetical protein